MKVMNTEMAQAEISYATLQIEAKKLWLLVFEGATFAEGVSEGFYTWSF